MPLITVLGELRVKISSLGQPGLHSETLFPKKNTKSGGLKIYIHKR
jgi:hypothetical protein